MYTHKQGYLTCNKEQLLLVFFFIKDLYLKQGDDYESFTTRMAAAMTRNFYCVCRFARIQLDTWQRSTLNWHRVQRGILNRTHCLSLGNLFWLPKGHKNTFLKKETTTLRLEINPKCTKSSSMESNTKTGFAVI